MIYADVGLNFPKFIALADRLKRKTFLGVGLEASLLLAKDAAERDAERKIRDFVEHHCVSLAAYSGMSHSEVRVGTDYRFTILQVLLYSPTDLSDPPEVMPVYPDPTLVEG